MHRAGAAASAPEDNIRLWGWRPEPEALKSGLAVVVQCGGTLAKACFLGWRTPFLFGGVRECIGNTLFLEGSSKDASPALRRVFYVVLEASGGTPQEHQEHPRSAQGRLRNFSVIL